MLWNLFKTYVIKDHANLANKKDEIIGLNDEIEVANSADIRGLQVGDILGFSLDLTDTA